MLPGPKCYPSLSSAIQRHPELSSAIQRYPREPPRARKRPRRHRNPNQKMRVLFATTECFPPLSSAMQRDPALSNVIRRYPALSKAIQRSPALASASQHYPALSSAIQSYPTLSKAIQRCLIQRYRAPFELQAVTNKVSAEYIHKNQPPIFKPRLHKLGFSVQVSPCGLQPLACSRQPSTPARKSEHCVWSAAQSQYREHDETLFAFVGDIFVIAAGVLCSAPAKSASSPRFASLAASS